MAASAIFLDPSLGNPPVIKVGGVCYQLAGPSPDISPDTFSYDGDVLDCDGCRSPCDCPAGLESDYSIHIPAGSIPNAYCSASGGTSSRVFVEWDAQDIAASGSCEDRANGWEGVFNYRMVLRTYSSSDCSGTPSGSTTLGTTSTAINLTLDGCVWDIYLHDDPIHSGGVNDFSLDWQKTLGVSPTGTYTEIESQMENAGIEATVS